MPRNNMPPNWEPPAPAWQAVWKNTQDPLVAGYFGIQAETPTLLDSWAKHAFTGAHAPQSIERGITIDQADITNHLYIGYWRHSEYKQWWLRQGNADWWADKKRLTETVGYWREIILMPFDRFETLHSTQKPHGVSLSADGLEGPIREHGYPGGMRDRIALSKTDDLKLTANVGTQLKAQITDSGSRVLITPPEKMCVIRSGQNWSFCDKEEKAYYLKKLHPVLLKGMHFLRDNPVETSCYALRFVDTKDNAWDALEQSFGLGYSTDIYAFENWAKSHPTHLAIFGGFLKMVETFGVEMKLRLWHEVTVVPGLECEFEYIGCHPKTGLLSYADTSLK